VKYMTPRRAPCRTIGEGTRDSIGVSDLWRFISLPAPIVAQRLRGRSLPVCLDVPTGKVAVRGGEGKQGGTKILCRVVNEIGNYGN